MAPQSAIAARGAKFESQVVPELISTPVAMRYAIATTIKKRAGIIVRNLSVLKDMQCSFGMRDSLISLRCCETPLRITRRTCGVASSRRGGFRLCRQQFIQARLPPVGCVLMDDAAFGCFIERRDERADVFGI